ncbi:unnamed protein product [Thelazia callipaeda]|uniref:G2/mitotic-specific cyclin-B3 n=1 Tax=Thelazia callipaeda TaxID=103827 RepID=A0A0N5CM26_THECL|nr:unnamed protein product [Thelazia callipaeda]
MPVRITRKTAARNQELGEMLKKDDDSSEESLQEVLAALRVSNDSKSEQAKDIAVADLGKKNGRKEGMQTRRAALMDMKNVVRNEDVETNKHAKEESLFSRANKPLKSAPSSPKRSDITDLKETQHEDEKVPHKHYVVISITAMLQKVEMHGICVLKKLVLLQLLTKSLQDLAQLVPSVKCDDINIHNQRVSEKPVSDETSRNVDGLCQAQKPALKPLPFLLGKHSLAGSFHREVVCCRQYAEDSWSYLFQIEGKGIVPENFLYGSKITPKHRMVTLDWVTRVQVSFKLLPETHSATINLFDRCLAASRYTLEKRQLQPMILGCAVVAGKFEEIYPPDISEYLNYCDSAKKDVLDSEIVVLRLLDYDLKYPRAIQFIRRLTEHYDLNVHTIAKTISDIGLYDYGTCHLKPSVNAAVSVYMAAALENVVFPEKLHKLARISINDIEQLVPFFAVAILDLIRNESHYNAIYKRMFLQRKINFTDEQLTYLVSMANKIL